ncbi:MAG: HAMP domain-containing protein [Betaproteobacteria bacterium]|nr:HAMP domain-containing protein [Betaproteobacteria bacterium]
MRRPISLKIFGIALGLLVMMACVTLVSSIQVRRLGDQLDFLASYFIQLDQIMGDVRANGLGEIILMERIFTNVPKMSLPAARAAADASVKDAGGCDSNAMRVAGGKIRQSPAPLADQQLVLYELIKLCSDRQLERAGAMVAQARALEAVQADRDQVELFANLRIQVSEIAPARAQLHAAFEDYLKEMLVRQSPAEERVRSVIRANVEQNRAAVSREISDVTDIIHAATRSSAERAQHMEQRVRVLSWGITIAAVFLGLLFAAYITRSLVKPVHDLLSGTKAIEGGNLNIEIKLQSADEIAELGDSFNHMVRELRQKEAIKDMFGKYVDPRVVQTLLERREFAQTGERRVMTVFFSDLAGFTAVAERLTPSGVVKLLNEYFTLMAQAIRAQNGIIDKYIGDSVMAFWGPPFCAENEHAALACLAALEQQERVARFQAMLPEVLGLRKDVPTVSVRMGLATGDVTVGSIGSDEARSYTVIGDTVNLASRLESVNKQYGTALIISEETRVLAKDAIEVRELDSVRVVGKTDAVRIYELLARKGTLAPARAQLRDEYEASLQRYRERKWDEAQRGFERCLAVDGHDGPSKLFLARIERMRAAPPAEGWDGAWTLAEK